MSELGDLYEYADSYLDQDDLSDGGSENIDSKNGADKRAHHNALERKRRDHIKDGFSSLRDAIPLLRGEKVNSHKTSRLQILKKAAEYIDLMKRKNKDHQKDIDLFRKENKFLEEQVREIEILKAANIQSGSKAAIATPNQSQCSTSLTVQTVLPAQVKVLNGNVTGKQVAVQNAIRMRSGSIGDSAGSGGVSLLNKDTQLRIKSECSSSSNESMLTSATNSDSEYSEPNETQVQIVKSDQKPALTTTTTNSTSTTTTNNNNNTTSTTNVTTTTASGLVVNNRNGTTLLKQPMITLSSKPMVYKQPSSGNKHSLLGPPSKRKRMAESGVTIIAANVGQLVGK